MIAIRIQELSKRYRIGTKTNINDTILSSFISGIKSPFTNFTKLRSLSTFNSEEDNDIVWALKNITFDLNQGEVLAVVGANGAGKSTLLKLISRITAPTSGSIKLQGRVASLLEVGTGFHPDLTGRENIYLNGTILGMTKNEIDKNFDEILDFSGVEKFIETPVKRYSTGMRMRLAFSVAAFLEPEILLIDEVLSVGDAKFQKKCIGKMNDIASTGRTVLFVSHRMAAVKSLCTKGILLDKGKLIFEGNVSQTVNNYMKKITTDIVEKKIFNEQQNNIVLKEISISSDRVISGQSFDINFIFLKQDNAIYISDITFHLVDDLGNLVYVSSTSKVGQDFKLENGKIRATCYIPKKLMNEGHYTLSHLMFVKEKGTVLFNIKNCFSFNIEAKERDFGWIGEKEAGIVDPYLNWKIKT